MIWHKNLCSAIITLFLLTFHSSACLAAVEEEYALRGMNAGLEGQGFVKAVATDGPGPRSTSGNGEWFAYWIQGESEGGAYETKLISLLDGSTYSIPGAKSGEFSEDSGWYIYTQRGGCVGVVNLLDGSKTCLMKTGESELLHGSDMVLAHSKSARKVSDEPYDVVLFSLSEARMRTIRNVTAHRYSTSRGTLAYAVKDGAKSSLFLQDLRASESPIAVLLNAGSSIVTVDWDEEGESLAFLRQGGDGRVSILSLLHWKSGRSTLLTADVSDYADFPSWMEIASKDILVSSNPRFLLFRSEAIGPSGDKVAPLDDDEGSVVIWSARNADLPGHAFNRTSGTFVWRVDSNTISQVGNDNATLAAVTKDNGYAVMLVDSKIPLSDGYDLDYKGLAADVYLVRLKDGVQRKILERLDISRIGNLSLSPDGSRIAYFREGGWWIYEIESDRHVDVTKGIGRALIETWPAGSRATNGWMNVPFGLGGWVDGDQRLMIYDEFDIWIASADGEPPERVTNGRDTGVRYRVYAPIYNSFKAHSYSPNSMRYQGRRLNTGRGIVLSAFGVLTKKSGYARLVSRSVLHEIVYSDALIDFIEEVPCAGKYVYRRQSFNLAPEFVLFDQAERRHTVLAKSNHSLGDSSQKAVKLISYINQGGQTLQGILHYPSGFRSGVKYPMVVDIYQHQSDRMHRYLYSDDSSSDLTADLTSDGYFVLQPDISYSVGDPGFSAMDSVIAAVNAVLGNGDVDSGRVGLIGHSFGGYETAFIVTQTDFFAAAVAGAPVTDLVSLYLSMHHQNPALFRFEYQQFGMGIPLHKDIQMYLRNSPVHNASQINTPLLSWAGEKDHAVPVSQSIELFNLLRRMRKEHVLLLYPEEGHVLTKKRNVRDLKERIISWFDYYLKNDLSVEWVRNATDLQQLTFPREALNRSSPIDDAISN